MIEVVQTAPGKFVTASGHSIKTATTPAAGGVKTIIRAAPSSISLQVGAYFNNSHFHLNDNSL